MKIETIFLDMDGVCCNFVKGTCAVLGFDYNEVLNNWPLGTYDYSTVMNIGPKEMWEKIDSRGKLFWRELQEYSWFEDLYDALKEIAPVYFLTSPAWNPDCAEGKLHWLQDRFGEDFRDYVLTHHKFLLSKKRSILIDDSPAQCDKFTGGDGRAILFPQPWNGHVLPDGGDPVAHIVHTIERFSTTA